MNDNTSITNEPLCTITPLPGIGERRTYRGLSQPFVAHEHGHYVIGLVKEGNRDLLCNGNLFMVSPGDMIILNPGDVHSCTQTDGAHFAYDSIAVDGAFFDSVKLHGPKRPGSHATDRANRLNISVKIQASKPSDHRLYLPWNMKRRWQEEHDHEAQRDKRI